MKIENNALYYNRISNRSIGITNTSFGDYLEKLNSVKKNSNRDQFVQNESMKFNDIGIYSKKEIKMSDLKFPIETERYKIELADEVEGVQAYVIKDKELGGGLYIREDELVLQRDAKTGMEFIINMDQPLSMNLLVTDELKSMVGDMVEKRGFKLQTGLMQGDLTIFQDTKTGLNYMTIKGNEAKGVSVVVTSQKDLETIEKLMQEFMKYPITSSNSTAGLYALLEISGNLRRGNEGLTYLIPNGVTYIPYDGDIKKAWEIEMSEEYYEVARKKLNTNIEFENSDAWRKILNETKITNGFMEVLNYYKFDSTGHNFQYKQKI